MSDSLGSFVMAYTCYFGTLSSVQAEAKALLFRFRSCLEEGYHHFIVEVNSMLLVHILQWKDHRPWMIQREIEELIQSSHYFI